MLKETCNKLFCSELVQDNRRLKEQVSALTKQVSILTQKVSTLTETKKKYFEKHDAFSKLSKLYQESQAGPWKKYLSACFNFTDLCTSFAPGVAYDLCIAHNHNSLSTAFEFAEKNYAPVVFDAVEITLLKHIAGEGAKKFSNDERGSKLIELYEMNFIKHCAGILAVSPGLQKWLKEYYSLKEPTLLRNCREYVPNQRNMKIRNLCNLNTDDKLILYVGLIYQNQGVKQVLEAMVYLPEKFHFATLGACRVSGYMSELKNKAEQLSVADRVHFLEPVPSVELLSLASGADFGIIPRQSTSLNNQFSLPNRIFEIVMARLPVAVGNLTDLKDLATKLQTGVVFDERSPESIAKAIVDLEKLAMTSGFGERLENAASKLSWSNEENNLTDMIAQQDSDGSMRSIAVFANKSVRNNNRLYRICKTLVEKDYEVTLFSKDDPEPGLKVPEVVYFNPGLTNEVCKQA